MNTKYLDKLEFNKVKNILASFAKTDIGKKQAISLQPLLLKKDILKALHQTTEGATLLYRKGNIPIESFNDINETLKKLNSSIMLFPKELLELAKILKIARNLKDYFFTNEIDMSYFTNLTGLFENLYTNLDLERLIFSSIIDENTIDDNASKELATIRKNLRNKEQEIKSKLNSFLHSKYIQEAVITMRNGRFVIPVKNEYCSELKGFIHDTSSSGATLYIEPISIFDMNNELNNLKNEENIEIQKVLMKLSSLFFELTNTLENTVNLIGLIDFIFAKAKYSNSLNAVEPIINDKKNINLMNAYHPLLPKEVAVKNDINLGQNFTNLIITGPNTGGKTVTLKTVGLITLMAMSGLHITAKEGSSIYIFDNIFADIGDEQSIADSLSTFSSHITNIASILNEATENSLVLLDELGSGTDPIEGASLAISILENLNYRNILNISTTHYPELKHYALVNENFENASVEFDIETLTPTYKLLLGVPGTSNAFEISRKLGISEEIISRAKSFLSSEKINIEELLKNIYDDKRKIELEKKKIIDNSNKIEELKSNLEKDTSYIEQQKQELINNAKIEARNILLSAKEDANVLIKEIENSNNSKELNNARNKINKKISNLSNINSTSISNILINSNDSELSTIKTLNQLNDNEITVNMEVFIGSLNQTGNIVSLNKKDKKATVQVGIVKMQFPFNELSINLENIKNIGNNASNSNSASYKNMNNFRNNTNRQPFTVKNISTEINVIGQNVDEACFTIDKYLDNCVLSHLSTVRIIHGKGTGALKNGIHKFLKTHPHVKNYHIGNFNEGAMGVTIVELK